MKTNTHFMSYLAQFLLKLDFFFKQICRENQNTHFTSNKFFLFENGAIYEIKWKSVTEQDRPQMTT